ncbi:MAG: hypothetical protein ACKVQS_02190 [Fimbriimonadaceae bacterium]
MIKAKRSVIISLYTAMAIPIVAVVSFGIWLYADLYSTSDRFHTEIENGSNEFIPVQPADFKRLNADSTDSATKPFLEAATAWEKLDESDRIKTLSQLRLYATPREVIAPTYQQSYFKCEPLIRKLRTAASRKDSNFEREWTGEGELLEPHYHTTVQFGRMLSAYALVEARLGNYNAAFSDLKNIRKIAQHYSRDAGLDGLALHVNLETQALTAAEEIAFLYGDKSGVLTKFDEFIESRKTTQPDLLRNVGGEAMRTVYVLSQPDSFKDRMFSGTELSLRNERFQKAAAVRMFDFWKSAVEKIKAVDQDPIASQRAFQEAFNDFSKFRSPSRMIPIEIASWNIRRLDLAASLEARYALAEAAGKLCRVYHETGQFPTSLSAALSNALDPFNDDSLAYRKTEDGFILYSVGIDGIDSGGDPNSAYQRDIILELNQGTISIDGV